MARYAVSHAIQIDVTKGGDGSLSVTHMRSPYWFLVQLARTSYSRQELVDRYLETRNLSILGVLHWQVYGELDSTRLAKDIQASDTTIMSEYRQ